MKKQVKVGNVIIGTKQPMVIQSMTNIKTTSIKPVLKQIHQLFICGCQLVRVSVNDEKIASAMSKFSPCLSSIRTPLNKRRLKRPIRTSSR